MTDTAELERVRSRSLWLETCGDDLTARPALGGDTEVDVAIVGGGLTGLWTALLLREADPSLRVLVVESEVCGFGASGRNGGWCSALFPASLGALESLAGRDAAIAQYRAMIDTVGRIGADLDRLGIDAHWGPGGTLVSATSPAHIARLRAEVAEHRRYGFGEDDLRWLTPVEARSVVAAEGTLGGAFTPHCATVQPARLVRGVARAAERAGARIVERTRALRLGAPPRAGAGPTVETTHGRVRAEVVLRCTEGYTPSLEGHERDVIPIYSMMIATEPLPAEVWDRIGFADRPTFSDGRHLLIYLQRTADGRLALGGRGAPYHWGSRITDAQDREPAIAAGLRSVLHRLFPATAEATVTHHWGGPLAVPRDWCASVALDRVTGLGRAGGYVGDGVSTTHLAARTLVDLVLGHDSDLVRLPWVDHESPRWEPEPFRWFGVNAGRALAGIADRREERTRRPAALAGRVIDLLTGGD
ncbi:MAG: NAD(P)/FAD-dependent oxidoreductase [Microthrixaceae bacterium]